MSCRDEMGAFDLESDTRDWDALFADPSEDASWIRDYSNGDGYDEYEGRREEMER